MDFKTLITVYIIVAGCVIAIHGKVYERCELARELRDVHEIPDNQLATWVCIARHESEYNTSAINHGSGDHGLLQISQLFWCSPPGYACGVSCDDLRNDDIEDDVICARRVYREHKRLSGDGFNAWVVYGLYCRDKQYASTFLEGCFKPGVLRISSEEIHEKPLPTVNYYPQFSWKTSTVPPTTAETIDVTDESTTTTKIIRTTKPSTTKRVKVTKPATATSTQKSTLKTTKISKIITKSPTKVAVVTTKSPSTTRKPAVVQTNNQGKPLRPTEENDEFTYAISKTGYKFTRF